MRLTLRALAALLDYPSEEMKAHIGEIRVAIVQEAALPSWALRNLDPLLLNFEQDDLLDLQCAYGELFDRSRALSLHLFEHVHGDSRERGQAMIDLGQQYISAGIFLESTELPDFIPVFLEFASCLPPDEARETLAQPVHVFAALAERLDGRETPYAGVMRAVLSLAGIKPDAEMLAELQANVPDDDPSRIDQEWEEAPVTFSAGGSHEMGGPTGVVAKIRAAKRVVTSAIKA